MKGGGAPYLDLANGNNDTPLSRACVLKLWDMAVTLVWGLKASTANLKRNLFHQLRLHMKLLRRKQPGIQGACQHLVSEVIGAIQQWEAGMGVSTIGIF